MWNSQPFIKNIPVGNILLSAAILFSGSTPTKVLHFLNCLRVACITDRTFYLHQRQYLEPSVQSVWNHKQQQLLSACELPLIIGGDAELTAQDILLSMALMVSLTYEQTKYYI